MRSDDSKALVGTVKLLECFLVLIFYIYHESAIMNWLYGRKKWDKKSGDRPYTQAMHFWVLNLCYILFLGRSTDSFCYQQDRKWSLL